MKNVIAPAVDTHFHPDMRTPLSELVKTGALVEIFFPNERVERGPFTEGTHYRLLVDNDCGLVVLDDDGDHVHLNEDSVIRFFKQHNAMISMSPDLMAKFEELQENVGGRLNVKLKERFDVFIKKHTFKPGDAVVAKPGIKKYKWPKEGQLAYVIGPCSPATHDCNVDEDIEILVFADSEEEARVFEVDSRYYMPADES